MTSIDKGLAAAVDAAGDAWDWFAARPLWAQRTMAFAAGFIAGALVS